jgi:hypothetical protein
LCPMLALYKRTSCRLISLQLPHTKSNSATYPLASDRPTSMPRTPRSTNHNSTAESREGTREGSDQTVPRWLQRFRRHAISALSGTYEGEQAADQLVQVVGNAFQISQTSATETQSDFDATRRSLSANEGTLNNGASPLSRGGSDLSNNAAWGGGSSSRRGSSATFTGHLDIPPDAVEGDNGVTSGSSQGGAKMSDASEAEGDKSA